MMNVVDEFEGERNVVVMSQGSQCAEEVPPYPLLDKRCSTIVCTHYLTCTSSVTLFILQHGIIASSQHFM